MYRLVESIKLKDGVFYRLKYHQERVNKAFEACFPNEEPINLFETLQEYSIPQSGLYKCRIVYDVDVQLVEMQPYVRRYINSLKLVETDIESRVYKSEDRSLYNEAFAKRSMCDDVLLVKNGLLTDASYSNIALFDGKEWFTPQTPLLYGVNRAELIALGKITEKDIKAEDLSDYQQIALFNAMIEFGELVLDVDVVNSL